MVSSKENKEKVLSTLYRVFDRWAAEHNAILQPVCSKQCAACCTQNVTVTAIEAEHILRYISRQGEVQWFAKALAQAINARGYHANPTCTTNEFARACFDGKEIPLEEHSQMEQCPFLKDDLCRIYEVRPFGCRLFVSSKKCGGSGEGKSQAAVLPDFYMDAATAANQLIEHLCQQEYWGNMLDVIAALLDLREYSTVAEYVAEHGAGISRTARMRTKSCQPLPGFMIGEENKTEVEPFLQQFFDNKIDGVRVEDILNGRQI